MLNISRFFNAAKGNYFIFGPRGTGKSTFLSEYYKEAVLVNLLDPEALRSYQASPNRLKELVLAHSQQKTFIIDEVQKAPALLSVIHELIEQKRGWQFILTGSSARKLKQTGVDLLGGRAQVKYMHPFMASELKNHFDFSKSLQLGMLPLVLNTDNPKDHLKAYIALYIREEVMIEGLVRRVEQFNLFLEAVSLSQASPLNYSNIAADCGISNKTVENYVNILEDLLIAVRLPVFSKRAKRSLMKTSKFYYFDAGVFQSIRPKGPLDDISAINGLGLETLVLQHLRAWIDYSDLEGKLYYWQTRSGLEVDFVIYGECGFYAIEVKAAKDVKPRDLRGLYEFQKDYPEAKLLILYMGKERRKINDILCMPIPEFLMQLVPNKMIDS